MRIQELNEKTTFNHRCCFLIDQNKYIGGDPIGHFCYNEAELTDGQYAFCKECFEDFCSDNPKHTYHIGASIKEVEEYLTKTVVFLQGMEKNK